MSRCQLYGDMEEMTADYRARFDVPHDCSVELSPLGCQFFTDIFQTFDKVFILRTYSNFRDK